MATIFENLRRSAYQRPWTKNYTGGIGSGSRYGESDGFMQQDSYQKPGWMNPSMEFYSDSTPGVKYSSFEEALAVGKEAQDSQDIEDYKRYAANLGLPETGKGFDSYRKEKGAQRQLEQQTARKNAEIAREQANRNREFAYKMAQANRAQANANRQAALYAERNRNSSAKRQGATNTGRGGTGGGSSNSRIGRLMSGAKGGAFNNYSPEELLRLVDKTGGDAIDQQVALDAWEQSRLGRGTKAMEASDKEIKKQVDNINSLIETDNLGQLSGVDVSRIPYDTAALLHNKIETKYNSVLDKQKNVDMVQAAFDQMRLRHDRERMQSAKDGVDYDPSTDNEEIAAFIKNNQKYVVGGPGNIKFINQREDMGESLADVSPFSHLFINDADNPDGPGSTEDAGAIRPPLNPETGKPFDPLTAEDLPLPPDDLINPETLEPYTLSELPGAQEASDYLSGLKDSPLAQAGQALAQGYEQWNTQNALDQAMQEQEKNRLQREERARMEEMRALAMSEPSEIDMMNNADELNRLLEAERLADETPPAFVGVNTMFKDPSPEAITPAWGATVEGTGISSGRKAWENLKAIPANVFSLIPEAANAVAPFYTAGSVEPTPQEVKREPILNPTAYTGGRRPKVTADYANTELLPRYFKNLAAARAKDGRGLDMNEQVHFLELANAKLRREYEVVDPEWLETPSANPSWSPFQARPRPLPANPFALPNTGAPAIRVGGGAY